MIYLWALHGDHVLATTAPTASAAAEVVAAWGWRYPLINWRDLADPARRGTYDKRRSA